MKTKNINAICFESALWPAVFLIALSILLSTILFKNNMKDIFERELNRHELIYQLISKAIIGDIIIKNDHAIYITLNEFKKKHNLEELKLEEVDMQNTPFKVASLLKNQQIISSRELPGIFPKKYISMHSAIETKSILMPLSLSIGMVLLFLLASIMMYLRITKQLHQRIIKPLKHTLHHSASNQKYFNEKTAAIEITDLYHKTQNFIKTLHEQRDSIEESKIKSAQYQMAVQIAHDIRSPALSLETISALSTELKDENKELINQVIHRIVQISDNILKTHTPDTVEISIGHILDNILNEKKAYCKNKNISFKASLAPNSHDTYINLSEEQISRVLSNILNNSIEAINNHGHIEISVELEQNYAHISIMDDGQGISPENLLLIFDDTFTANKPNGNGLGLFHARQVIEAVGGTIQAHSTCGQGATIQIVLPIAN